MKTTAIAINMKNHAVQIFELGRKRADEVWPIMREIYNSYEIQGFKLSNDVRSTTIDGTRYVLFGFK